MSMRHFERRELAQRSMPGRRPGSRRAPVLDNDVVRLERAGLLVACGLAGVSICSVAGFMLGGFDSSLSMLLPSAFLGWLFVAIAGLQE